MQKISAGISVAACALLITAALTILPILNEITQLQERRIRAVTDLTGGA